MSYTHEWKINYLDTKLNQNALEKVVVSCQWSINSADSEDPKIRASNYGYCTFGEPDEENFIAYNTLTEETVLEWIWANGVSKSNVESGMEISMDAMRNPPTVVLGNPWTPAPVVLQENQQPTANT